jgi:hypothetical protein
MFKEEFNIDFNEYISRFSTSGFFGGELEIYICSLIFNCSIYIWGYRYINNANDAISYKNFYLLNCYKNNNNRELHLLFAVYLGCLLIKIIIIILLILKIQIFIIKT